MSKKSKKNIRPSKNIINLVESSEIIVEGIIYKITNTINNKIYIGKTKTHYGNQPHDIEKRLQNHIASALRGNSKKHGSPALCNAIVKHGKKKFIIEEILRCDLERC